MSSTDKIAGLKEILALDPKNSFARYGIAMELANRGEVDGALKEFEVADRARSRTIRRHISCQRRRWLRQGERPKLWRG